MRIGGDCLIPIDVRIIAATNQDLWELVQQGKFRKDLYYRLNVLELYIPTLRERLEDIPALIRAMLAKKAPHLLQTDSSLLTDVFAVMQDYAWPGNIRELENIVERFSTLIQNIKPSPSAYRQIMLDCFKVRPQMRVASKGMTPSAVKKPADIGAEEIAGALAESAGKRSTAAKKLGISRMTLYRRIKKDAPVR
jgi:transcriptional regulator with PAS, ATPase and Fis domain